MFAIFYIQPCDTGEYFVNNLLCNDCIICHSKKVFFSVHFTLFLHTDCLWINLQKKKKPKKIPCIHLWWVTGWLNEWMNQWVHPWNSECNDCHKIDDDDDDANMENNENKIVLILNRWLMKRVQLSSILHGFILNKIIILIVYCFSLINICLMLN